MGDGSVSDSVLRGLHGALDDLEALYKDIHSHPELSLHEKRTAGLAAKRLKAAGFEVTEDVGGTGVVGLLENGDGPTVMLRADMDALPVKEDTGLPYASAMTATDPDGNETPVMHACRAARLTKSRPDTSSACVIGARMPGGVHGVSDKRAGGTGVGCERSGCAFHSRGD